MGNGINWPARAYIYGTWGYALNRARDRAAKFQQRMWLYRGVLDAQVRTEVCSRGKHSLR